MTEVMRYSPQRLDLKDLTIEELYLELGRVQEVLDAFLDGYREVLHAEPAKRRTGLMVTADGTDWNPGGGFGVYEYTGSGTNGWRMLASGVQY